MNCDLPVRLDTYRGCGFACGYCLERLKRSGDCEPQPEEGVRALRAFILGKRTVHTNWCDWDIPLHWGGMSDPFQPAELRYGRSLAMLRVFADTGYPFVVSTKSTMLLHPPYRDLVRRCNVVLQVSLCSPQYARWERGAPSFGDRLLMLWKLAPIVKRVIVRIQPYMPRIKSDVLHWLRFYAASGVYGITIEGLKWNEGWGELTENYGGSMVYPVGRLAPDYAEISQAAHDVGLRFYCAENRLRFMGDSPTCCGCDGLSGFRVNEANMNYYPILYTERMRESGTGSVFRSLSWTAEASRRFGAMSYEEAMLDVISGC